MAGRSHYDVITGSTQGQAGASTRGAEDPGMRMSTIPLGDIMSVQRESHVLAAHSKEPAMSYRSNQRMMRDRQKHVRQRLDARDLYTRPVTESQRIGWYQQVNSPQKPQHGKVACKETKLIEHAMLTQDIKPAATPARVLLAGMDLKHMGSA